MTKPVVDILIPTYNRPYALAVTLTSLTAQTFRSFRVVISDQSEREVTDQAEVRTAINVLRIHGNTVEVYRHLPRRGMAEQRQFLLDQAVAPYALFLDDDLILETVVVENLITSLLSENAGFAGCAVIGLSYLDDVRLHEQEIEFWDTRVIPEQIRPEMTSWQRYRLHNAANLYHVQTQMGLQLDKPRKYKVAWVGGCVMYNTSKLRSIGGFSFWKDLPAEHSGEDVLAQLRVMQAYGGYGLIPSGVYHQELPTTIPDRHVDAPKTLKISTETKMN